MRPITPTFTSHLSPHRPKPQPPLSYKHSVSPSPRGLSAAPAGCDSCQRSPQPASVLSATGSPSRPHTSAGSSAAGATPPAAYWERREGGREEISKTKIDNINI